MQLDQRQRVQWTLQQKFFLCFAFATTLIGACSSTSRHTQGHSSNPTNGAFPPPPAFADSFQSGLEDRSVAGLERALEKALRDDASDATRFWVRYRQAALWTKTDAPRACRTWLELSRESTPGAARFPLTSVARVRALETCPPAQPELTALSDGLLSSQPSWMREAILRAALARAVRLADKRQELRFALEVAPFESQQTDQIRLLERARVLARELADGASEETSTVQLEKLAPRLIAAPRPDQFLAVAQDFKKAREFSKARDFFRKAIAAPPETCSDLDRLRALDGIRMTYKLEQNTESFVAATRDYARFARAKFISVNIGKYVETRITLARAVWTDGSPTEADQILTELEVETKGKFPLDDILFLRARIAEEGGHYDRAANFLDRLADLPDSKRNSDRGLRRKIAWYHAWILRKSGKLKEAAERLGKLVMEEEDTPTLAARDHFWLGRVFKDLGDHDSATTQFDWLIANDPLGYYGLLAHRELGRLLPAIAAARPEEKAPPAAGALTTEEQLLFDWLIAVEEGDLGRRFLDQVGAARRAGFSADQTLDYLQLYARTGSYQSLFARLTDLPPETRQAILDKRPELLFPRPWPAVVSHAAEKFSVKQELIFSIMRQESSFNPTARSSADALGLMQLIPQVARLSAEGTDVPYRAHEDLYQPEINIALGSAHLRQLLNRWRGHFIPLVASYNASERAVQGWLHTRDHRDPLQFIEDIPYEETKGYVKLVMRNFVFYSRLTTREPAIPFPEWCLNGLQDFKP